MSCCPKTTRWYEPINKRSMRWSSTQKCPTKVCKHGIQQNTGCKYRHASSVYSFMYWCVFLCLCLYVCFHVHFHVSIYTSVYLSMAVYAYLYSVVYSCLYLSICQFSYLCIYLSTCLSTHPSKHPSIYLSVYLAMYPSNCLSAFFFMYFPIKSTYPFIHAWVYPQYSGETTRWWDPAASDNHFGKILCFTCIVSMNKTPTIYILSRI